MLKVKKITKNLVSSFKSFVSGRYEDIKVMTDPFRAEIFCRYESLKSKIEVALVEYLRGVRDARFGFINIPWVFVCTSSVALWLGFGTVMTLLICASVSLFSGVYNGFKHIRNDPEDKAFFMPDDLSTKALQNFLENAKSFLNNVEEIDREQLTGLAAYKFFLSRDNRVALSRAVASLLTLTSKEGKIFGIWGQEVKPVFAKSSAAVLFKIGTDMPDVSKRALDFKNVVVEESDNFRKDCKDAVSNCKNVYLPQQCRMFRDAAVERLVSSKDAAVERLVSSKDAAIARLVSSKETVKSSLGFAKAKAE